MKFCSFLRRTVRRIWIPHTCSRPGRYLSDLNGIAISIDHPPSKSEGRVSQTGFQSRLGLPSSVICPSTMPPMAFPKK